MVQKINPHPALGCNRSLHPLLCIFKRCNSWECSVHFLRGPWLHSIPSWLVWAEMAHKPVKPSWAKQTTGVKSLLPKYILWILARRCKLMINYTWQSPKTTIARFSTRNIVCKQTCTYLMLAKGQTKSKWFFQVKISSKNRMNELDFTTKAITFVGHPKMKRDAGVKAVFLLRKKTASLFIFGRRTDVTLLEQFIQTVKGQNNFW